MKQSQLYMILGQMCFVGSFLTNHLWDSLLLFIMMIYWFGATIFAHFMERKMEMLERLSKRLKDEIIIETLIKLSKGKKR